ncbi:unnamed protein product [Cyclocybe aegerita]|uniref:Transmembrane protein n=1 Tax=Cyclocybe aegerita TaxID=1973307 RepID=A0A8S0Y126_CYCAE|nr:unnamed protein product [Cyclocybe aegerita]
MPSRRRTRRAPRSTRVYSRAKRSSRPKPKVKVSHKPRLVRRYVRRKQDDSKAHSSKHSSPPNLSGQDKPRISNPALKSAGSNPPNNAYSNGKTVNQHPAVDEITAVPNPTPDTGITPTTALGAGYPLFGALSETSTSGLIIPSTSSSNSSHSPTPPISFSALPPLPSRAPSSTVSGENREVSSSAFLPIETSPPNSRPQANAAQAHQVNVAVIVLLAVGSALLLLGACIMIKMCTRPRRQPRPTPSLPILKDVEADEDFFETQESPIFGGKERLSPMPGVGGPTWAWVQYPNPRSSQSLAPPQQEYHTASRPVPELQTASIPQSTTNQMYANLPAQPAIQPIPTAVLHSTKRQSIASMYSPVTNPKRSSMRQDTVLTADGHDFLKRSKSKNSPRRSQLGLDEKQNRDSLVSCAGLAYDGGEADSPGPGEYVHTQQTPVLSQSFEGRARIRSGYFAAGTYPRISTLPSASYSIATATRINVGQRNSFSKDKLALQKRQRDTEALAYALGLASPRTEYVASSPQPTLYPDDSMSVVDTAKRHKKRNLSERRAIEAVPDVPVIVPTEKATSSFMTMEFGVSQMSLSALALEPASEGGTGRMDGHREPDRMDAQFNAASQPPSSRHADKPPRVPSPPPLLSLTQMGLQQHNPEAFASYRSPTYSLYGLYEGPDRKSFVR